MALSVQRKKSAGVYHTQQVHYLYCRFNFNDADTLVVASGKFCIGTLPADCLPLETYVRINTTFDKDFIMGTSVAGSSAAVCSTYDVLFSSTGTYVVDRFMGTRTTIDVPIYAQLNTSGGTIGQADIWQAYLPVTLVSTAA
jgi:hypothetical protein